MNATTSFDTYTHVTGTGLFLTSKVHGKSNKVTTASYRLLLPYCVLAERVRDALAAHARSEPHSAIGVSFGVAAWRPGRTAEQVLEAAEGMLYAAKRAGKDRIMTETAVTATET